MVWLQPRRTAHGEKDEDKYSHINEKLFPELPDYEKFKQCDKIFKESQKCNYGQRCAACNKLNHFARMCRSKQVAVTPKVPNSNAKKNVFTVDGQHCDMSDSQEESENLLIDPLRIDRLTHHKAWMSRLLTSYGDIICRHNMQIRHRC